MHRIPSCPVCGNKNLIQLLTVTDYTTTGESFQIESCNQCTLMVTNPQPAPANLGKYYESSSYTSHAAKPSSLFEKVYAAARSYALRWKLQLIRKYAHHTENLLDLGCGVGDFLLTCRQNQIIIAGVEPSPNAR